ncbi:hypothetical protein WDU94_009847 [Cyamophila willieti]
MLEEETYTTIITTDPVMGTVVEQIVDINQLIEIHEIPVAAESSPPDLQVSFSSSESTGDTSGSTPESKPNTPAVIQNPAPSKNPLVEIQETQYVLGDVKCETGNLGLEHNDNEVPIYMTPSPSSSDNDDSDRDPDFSPGQGDKRFKHVARNLSQQDGHVDKEDNEEDDDYEDEEDDDHDDEEEDDDDDHDDKEDDITVIHRGSFCYFCEKKVTKMKRHIFAKHATENEIKTMNKKAMTEEMNNRLLEITRLGDFYNNMKVLDCKSGELKVVKNHDAHYSKYGPCPCCFGFIMKKNLKNHTKTCPKGTQCSKGTIVSESKALTFQYTNTLADSKFALHVLKNMKDDDITDVIRKSQNIQAVGEFLFQKYGVSRPETPRQIMRLLGRVLCAAREKTKRESLLLEELLSPEFFDTIVQIAKAFSGEQDGQKNKEMKNPSTARRIGFAVRKGANVLKGIALRKKNQEQCKKFDDFNMLVKMEWGTRINSTALSSERQQKRRNPKPLPLTEDLITLTKFVTKEMEKQQKLLEEKKDAKSWFTLTKLVFLRILLFNRKRTGELGKMLTDDLKNVKRGDEINDQVLKSFSKSEQEIAQQMNLIEIEGKRGTVPVLLTSEMLTALQSLLKFRTENGICPKNVYFFPAALDSFKAMRGHAVLRKFTLISGLTEPLAITGTQLRKFISTSLQLLNLKENELDFIARHLGHDILVHRKFYRLQDDAVELAKVAKLLLMIDQGRIHEFVGQTLDNLTVHDDDNVLSFEDGDGPFEDGDGDVATPTKNINNHAAIFSVTPTSGKNKGRIVATKSMVITPIKKVKVQKAEKKSWTESEKKSIKSAFHLHIKKGLQSDDFHCLPKKSEIEEFLLQSKLTRTWREVKDYVRNTIVRLRRVKK